MQEEYEDREDISQEDSHLSNEPEHEESHIDDNHEDSFDENSEEVPTRQANRLSGKKRIGQLTREKYQLLDALRQANEEKEALRQQSLYLNSSLGSTQNAALTQHQNSIALKTDNARKAKIKAYEEGDIEAQVKADELLAEAKAEELQANMWKIQNDNELKKEQENLKWQQEQYQQQQQAFNRPHIDENLFYDWVEDNDWFNPQSRNHNPHAHRNVVNYAKQVDDYLIKMGRPDKILSPEYFEELDAFVQREGYNQRANNGRQLEMRNNHYDVAPVTRGGYGTTSRGGSRTSSAPLTQEDREMAKAFGVSNETFAKYKAADIKKQKEKGRPY